jgi:hypothetical protein
MAALIVVLFLVLAGAAFYLSWYFKQRRIKGLAAAAVQLGLEFSQEDPFGTLSEPFQLFRKGDGQGVENVMWGTWQGIDVRQFDFWYYEESTDGQGHRSKTYYRFNCVQCPIDAVCANLTIDHENPFSRLADALSFHDIEFESEVFNRAYNVKCSDKKFASDFVDPRMIKWLMKHGDGYSFEACADRLLVAHHRLQPLELIPLLGTAQGFSKAVPRVVFELYPRG